MPLPRTKCEWLALAEVIDALRVFPRLFLALYVFYLWDVHNAAFEGKVAEWYAALVWGGLVAITKFYVDTGRNWK